MGSGAVSPRDHPLIETLADVRRALADGRPVVALESAVITAGLPAEPLRRAPTGDPGWDPAGPANLETARLLERTVRRHGAVPATVGIVRGVLRIGLDDAALLALAGARGRPKASVRELALGLCGGLTAGTTVSATLRACELAPRRIRVMATGGIGGVHRGWPARLDVSADLRAMANAPVCVVCSGVKAVLDVAATLEALEALGVPVVAHGADEFPLFYGAGRPELPAPARLDDPGAIAALCRAHWDDLGLGGGVLVANPVPAALALDAAEIERIVAEADASPARGGSTASPAPPPARTPQLLERVAQRTGGRAVAANIALLESNAALAARIASALARTAAGPPPENGNARSSP